MVIACSASLLNRWKVVSRMIILENGLKTMSKKQLVAIGICWKGESGFTIKKGEEMLKPEEIKESKINEPLTNWHSFDGQIALDAIYESGGFAEYASDTKMMEFSKLTRSEEGLSVLPAAASTLAVMQTLGRDGFIVKGTFVAVLTGRDFD